jgi:hypothetical protein
MLSKDVKARIARNRRRRIACRNKHGREFYRIRPAAAWNNWKSQSPFLPHPWLKDMLKQVDAEAPIPVGGEFDKLMALMKDGFKRGELFPLIGADRPSQYKSDLFGSMVRRHMSDPAMRKLMEETIVVFPKEHDAKRFMSVTRGKARQGEGAFKIDLEKPWDIVGLMAECLGGDVVDMKHQEEAERRVLEELTQTPDLVLSPMSDIHFGDMKRGMKDGTVSFTTLDSYSSFEDESNDGQRAP